MFNPDLCDRSFPDRPVFVDWLTSIWFNRPLLISVVLLIVFGIYCIIRYIKRKRLVKSKRRLVWLAIFTATLVLMPFVVNKALIASLPTDPGKKVDAIVVLGRGAPFARPRVNLAAELWQNQRAPVIFVSGRGDASDLIAQLEEKGIPERSLDGEECSVTTWENAIFTDAILQPQGIRQILLITDALHMWRSILVFRAQGFDVIPRISPIDFYFVGKRGKSFLALREYSGLVEYGLRGLYFPKHSSELNNPELVNIVQKAQRYGQQQQLKPE